MSNLTAMIRRSYMCLVSVIIVVFELCQLVPSQRTEHDMLYHIHNDEAVESDSRDGHLDIREMQETSVNDEDLSDYDKVRAHNYGVNLETLRRCKHAGKAEADRDIICDKLKLKAYGLRTDEDFEYAIRLKSQMGVDTEIVAGCSITPELEFSTESYNDRMKQEIRRRFGQTALDR